MKPLRLSSNKVIAVVLLWLLSLGSHSAVAQLQWECGPAYFNYGVSTLYVDSTDSTLYAGGMFRTVNGQPDTAIIGLRPDGSLRRLPSSGLSSTKVITKWNGKLLAGGFGGLAEYNGTSWQKIIPGAIATVWSLHPYQGKLLVGGTFLTDSSLGANYDAVLKEWDGTTLTTFKGIDSIAHGFAVNAIAEYNGDLIVGGNIIPNVGDSSKFKDIMRWTGTLWQPLGNTGLPGGGLDGVNDIVALNGQLYVAGQFYESNGSPGNSIARWDGSQWHRLGGGLGPGGSGVYDLEIQGDTLIVAGSFGEADDNYAMKLARYWNGHWCGNDWPNPSAAVGVKNWFGTVIVGGKFLRAVGTDTCGHMATVTSWGDCFAQATASVPAEEGSISKTGLIAHPNPANDDVKVEFSVRVAGITSLSLSDATGRTIQTQTLKVTEGLNRVTMDLKGIPTGHYLIQLSTETGHEAIKIVKQ